MLDDLHPSRLDRQASSIRASGRGCVDAVAAVLRGDYEVQTPGVAVGF
jgi:hypothetical protein